jgi:hypothetical protein
MSECIAWGQSASMMACLRPPLFPQGLSLLCGSRVRCFTPHAGVLCRLHRRRSIEHALCGVSKGGVCLVMTLCRRAHKRGLQCTSWVSLAFPCKAICGCVGVCVPLPKHWQAKKPSFVPHSASSRAVDSLCSATLCLVPRLSLCFRALRRALFSRVFCFSPALLAFFVCGSLRCCGSIRVTRLIG